MKLFIIFLLIASVFAVDQCLYLIKDHPDGSARPPLYCLRLDHFFSDLSGQNRITTFSCDQGEDVIMIIDDHKIVIKGQVFGGENNGNEYLDGFHGLCNLEFTYNNIKRKYFPNGKLKGWIVNGANYSRGTLDCPFLDKKFHFYGSSSMSVPFLFLKDNHRLGNNVPPTFVGRGWLTKADDHSHTSETQDWLFTGCKLCPTRDIDFWKCNGCLNKLLSLFVLNSKVLDSNKIRKFIGRNAETQLEELKQQLLVLALNIAAFNSKNCEYRDNDFETVLLNTLEIIEQRWKDQYEDAICLLKRINNSGKDVKLPKTFRNKCKPCPKDIVINTLSCPDCVCPECPDCVCEYP